MKKLKKALAVIMSMAIAVSMFVGCNKDDGAIKEQDKVVGEDTGKELVIYAWNEDWKKQFEKYYQDKNPAELKDIEVKWVINPNEKGVYQSKLDLALQANEKAKPEKKVDLFLVEADYAKKYVGNASIALKNLKIDTDKEMNDQYEYTKNVVRASNGDIKGTTWQACPGLLTYRRDIAEKVLGVSKPEDVQQHVKDWDTFTQTAKKMKDAGYFMFSGYHDLYRVFSANVSKPQVDENKILIDESINKWIDMMKDFTDKGYHQKSSLWDNTLWGPGMGKDGKVFCYFWSTWGINFCLNGFAMEDADAEAKKGNGTFGNWGACPGPQPYYWGGTWMMCASGSDNPNLVATIMRKWTMDKDFMKKFTVATQDMSNTMAGMQEIADDPKYGAPVLDGQNHVALFVETAKRISMKHSTPYGLAISEEMQTAMPDYFNGTISKDQALDNYYAAVHARHAQLTN